MGRFNNLKKKEVPKGKPESAKHKRYRIATRIGVPANCLYYNADGQLINRLTKEVVG